MKLEILNKVISNNQNFTLDELKYIDELVKRNILKNIDNTISINKKYKVGTIRILKGIVKLFPFGTNDKVITIDNEHTLNSYDGDIVIVQMIFNPRGRLKSKVIDIVKRDSCAMLCYIKDDIVFDIKNSIKLDIKSIKLNLKDGDIFLLKDGELIELFGNISQPKIDERISLYLYGESYRVNDTNHYDIKEIKDYSKRVDLTSLEFCTIDPASAKDHDDAIYFDEINSILYVAIADVSAYIKDGSKLDIEAKKRAFSIYLPNKVLPMIPFELSANLCSLKPDVKRLAYVIKMKIDTKRLIVTKSELIEAVIISKHKYSYEDIDAQIEQNSLPISLDTLYKLTVNFRKKRLKDGYDFRTNEYRLKLDENEELVDVIEERGSPSHKLVEECMLLANVQSASKLDGLGIYRVHEEPDRKKLEQLLDSVNLLGIKAKLKEDVHSTILSIQQKAQNVDLVEQVDKLIIQSQQQARYTSRVASHFGLGFTSYSHFTSPIRRYSDLVLHRILKSKNIPNKITKESLLKQPLFATFDNICEDISNKERDIAKLVWDLEDRKYARWASVNIGNSFAAIVVDVDDEPKGEFTCDMQGLRFYIQDYKGEQLFSKVKVEIVSSDIISKKIITKIMI